MVITTPHFFSSAPRGADFLYRPFRFKRPHLLVQTSACSASNVRTFQPKHRDVLLMPPISYLILLTSYPIHCSTAQLPPATDTAPATFKLKPPDVLGTLRTAHKHIQHLAPPAILHPQPTSYPSLFHPLVPLNSSLAPLTPYLLPLTLYLLPQPGYLPAPSSAFRFPSANSRMFVE